MKRFLFLCAITTFVFACGGDEDETIDKEKPTIDISQSDFQNCSVVKKGEVYTFTAKVSDNESLGSFGIDIHNNFDHHNHSTESEVKDCEMGEKKEATNPFKLVVTKTIADNPSNYTIQHKIIIPKEYESGDYHFMLKVVDKAGWSTLKGLSFKVRD